MVARTAEPSSRPVMPATRVRLVRPSAATNAAKTANAQRAASCSVAEPPRLLSRGAIAYAESVASDAANEQDILGEFSRRMILAGAIKILQAKIKQVGISTELRNLELELRDELLRY